MKAAVIGFFCFGFILGPVAVYKALAARREIRDNPLLTGWGKANAALVLGIIVSLLAVLNFVGRLSQV